MALLKPTVSPLATAASSKKIGDESDVIRDPSSLDRLTELNSIDSPLLRLPAEIRGMIFTYIFSGEKYLFHRHDGNTLTCGRSFTELNMSFLLVSRQAHAETALLPYNHGTICFRLDEDEPDRLVTISIETFLEKRSVEQLKAIASLETCVRTWDTLATGR